MIQFNLLPDVKKEYIKTQRIKRLVINSSLIASVAAVSIFLVLASSVYVVQRKNIHDLSADIKTSSRTFEITPDISDTLTVQSQLNSLSKLHEQKPTSSRLFNFLTIVTPDKVTISDVKIDFTQSNITMTGNTPGLDVVNTFVDNLKFTTYTLQGQASAQKAFSTVVLSSFSRSATSATYTVTFNFDPVIFNNANAVTLNVGGQTQSNSQQPSIIFKKGNQ
jgi:Tfp pilus assembly protein PilN